MWKLQELTVSQHCEFEGHGAFTEVVGSTNKFMRNLYSGNWYSEYDDKTLANSLRYFYYLCMSYSLSNIHTREQSLREYEEIITLLETINLLCNRFLLRYK